MKKNAIILCLITHSILAAAQINTAKTNSQQLGGNISMHSTSLTFIRMNEDWYIAEKKKRTKPWRF